MKLKKRTASGRSRFKFFKTPRREGAAVVEFAIIAPVFLAMVFGMVEISRMLMLLHATTAASREAVRAAVVTGADDGQVRQVATEFMANSFFQTDSIEINITEGPSSIPDMVNRIVEVSIEFEDVSILGNPFQAGRLAGNASMIAPTGN